MVIYPASFNHAYYALFFNLSHGALNMTIRSDYLNKHTHHISENGSTRLTMNKKIKPKHGSEQIGLNLYCVKKIIVLKMTTFIFISVSQEKQAA